MAIVPAPKRGDIWLVDFDPAVGAELRKLRPAIVVSLTTIGRLPLRLVVPIKIASRRPAVGLQVDELHRVLGHQKLT